MTIMDRSSIPPGKSVLLIGICLRLDHYESLTIRPLDDPPILENLVVYFASVINGLSPSSLNR
jgi:hypothetical protein